MQPAGAIHGPGLTFQSAAPVPTTANPFPLGLGFPVGTRHFEPPVPLYLFPTTPESAFASGAAPRLYEHEPQNRPFSPLATLGSTSAFVPPSDEGIFNPARAATDFTAFSDFLSTTEKQAVPLVPARGERPKRRKYDEHLADQQDSSIGLPPVNTGLTNAIVAPITVPSFDRPKGMSRGEYVRLLHAKIAVESELGE
jgi:hypothetical protein